MVWKTWGELFNELIKRMELSFGKIATALSEYHDELSEEERSTLKSINAEIYVSLDAAAYWNFANNNRKPPPRERLLLFIHFFNRKLTGTKGFTFEEVKAFVKLAGLHELSLQECKVLFGHEQHQISELRDGYIHQVSDSNVRTDEALKSDVDEIKAGIRRILRKQGKENTSNEVSLNEAEQLFDSLPTDRVPLMETLPMGSRMPFGPSPLFVGRESELKSLANSLKGGTTTAIGQIAAATGLGGIGKTQLAIEFVHRYGQFFAGGVYWLNFSEASNAMTEIAACGLTMRELRGDYDTFKLEEQVRLVISAWENSLPRLLVFDNCDDQNLLAQWRPKTGGSRVLITSRRQQWDNLFNVESLMLGILSRKQSVELLRKFRPDLTAEDPILHQIANELGDLPLALHLAGNYLKRYQYEVTPYQYFLQLKSVALLQHRSMQQGDISPTGHIQHVARTFAVSYDRLQPNDPLDSLALDLLMRAVWFAPNQLIPRSLLSSSIYFESEDAKLQIADALQRLENLGLIGISYAPDILVHPLIANFVHNTDATKDKAAKCAVTELLIQEATELLQDGFIKTLNPWQVHLQYIANSAQNQNDETEQSVCSTFGAYLYLKGDFSGAKKYFERSIELAESLPQIDIYDVALAYSNLASLRCELGDYEDAIPLYEHTIELFKNAYGDQSSHVAKAYTNLGVLYNEIGDVSNARPYLEQSLALNKSLLGEWERDTAISYHNLGSMFVSTREIAKAKSHYEHALKIREVVLGNEHPETAISYYELGVLYMTHLDDFLGAKPYLEKSLAILEMLFGTEHPEVTKCYGKLGDLHQELGELATARVYYHKELANSEATLGHNHLKIALSYAKLGKIYQAMEDLSSAESCIEKELAILESCLGSNHDTTQAVISQLDDLRRARQGSNRPRRIYLVSV